MKIGFIIVNYHSDDDTLSVINDLLRCKLPSQTSFTIYAVDNSCSEVFQKSISRLKSVKYVQSPGNVGFAAGNNLGIKKALKDEADIIVLLNNDTILKPDFIESILESPISNPKIGIIGGLIYFAKGYEFEKKYKPDELGKVIWYAGGILDWDNVYGKHRGVNEVDDGQYSKIQKTDFVTGCLLIARRNIFEEVGILNEDYCMYHEDTDFNLRVQQRGYQTIFDPGIKLWHKVAQSSGIGSPLNDYFLTRNRLILGLSYAKLRTKTALLKEAIFKLFSGTHTQKQAILDFFIHRWGKGSFLK